ncbi:hypothetical protein DEU56DRAFT_953128 [Suillus clintonianus]|uniref:uncharacterized protein n=1 Tax=Suillus clintonianus TaxID=1904413 RepID=UPI001B85F735|nr:uncharacterized protein DEU56DRAFT_953128 [Suillus clintonianus]KAG2132072.1 hypothetical protein DEU56DRAFT_953128 [Suillus clintonianus]
MYRNIEILSSADLGTEILRKGNTVGTLITPFILVSLLNPAHLDHTNTLCLRISHCIVTTQLFVYTDSHEINQKDSDDSDPGRISYARAFNILLSIDDSQFEDHCLYQPMNEILMTAVSITINLDLSLDTILGQTYPPGGSLRVSLSIQSYNSHEKMQPPLSERGPGLQLKRWLDGDISTAIEWLTFQDGYRFSAMGKHWQPRKFAKVLTRVEYLPYLPVLQGTASLKFEQWGILPDIDEATELARVALVPRPKVHHVRHIYRKQIIPLPQLDSHPFGAQPQSNIKRLTALEGHPEPNVACPVA